MVIFHSYVSLPEGTWIMMFPAFPIKTYAIKKMADFRVGRWGPNIQRRWKNQFLKGWRESPKHPGYPRGKWWKMMENDGKWWKMMENDGKWWKMMENCQFHKFHNSRIAIFHCDPHPTESTDEPRSTTERYCRWYWTPAETSPLSKADATSSNSNKYLIWSDLQADFDSVGWTSSNRCVQKKGTIWYNTAKNDQTWLC